MESVVLSTEDSTLSVIKNKFTFDKGGYLCMESVVLSTEDRSFIQNWFKFHKGGYLFIESVNGAVVLSTEGTGCQKNTQNANSALNLKPFTNN